MNFAIMYNLPAVYYIMAPGSKGTTWSFSHCICGGEPSGGKVSILPSPPPSPRPVWLSLSVQHGGKLSLEISCWSRECGVGGWVGGGGPSFSEATTINHKKLINCLTLSINKDMKTLFPFYQHFYSSLF
jgi:hypothetical protein